MKKRLRIDLGTGECADRIWELSRKLRRPPKSVVMLLLTTYLSLWNAEVDQVAKDVERARKRRMARKQETKHESR